MAQTPSELLALLDDALTVPGDARRYPTLDDYGAALDELRRRETPLPVVRSLMADPKAQVKPGDPCPNCDGTFKAARQPSDAQRALAASRDNPVPFPPDYDTAPAAFVQEHGALYKCVNCGYQTRMQAAPPQASSAPAGSPPATSASSPAGSQPPPPAAPAAGPGPASSPFPAAGSQ